MLKVMDETVKGLEFNFELSDIQRGILASAIKQEWFDLLQKLMEQEVRLLNIRLLNTPGNDPTGILANHAIAKGAGMFYAGLMQRLEILLQIENSKASTVWSLENPEVPPYLEELTETAE